MTLQWAREMLRRETPEWDWIEEPDVAAADCWPGSIAARQCPPVVYVPETSEFDLHEYTARPWYAFWRWF